MVFHRARPKPNNNNNIMMDGNVLTKVNSAKYLGVIIDPNFFGEDDLLTCKKSTKNAHKTKQQHTMPNNC